MDVWLLVNNNDIKKLYCMFYNVENYISYKLYIILP